MTFRNGIILERLILGGFGGLSAFRMQNVGWSKWWALLLVVPGANLFAITACFALPAGYARDRQLDVVGGWIIGGLVVAAIAYILPMYLG